MRVLILTYGSRGDVQPYVALGRGLAAAGHAAILAASARFEGFVRENGLDFAPLDDGLLSLIDTEQGKEMLENTRGAFGALRRTLGMAGRLREMNARLLRDSWAAAEAVRPDLIVFHVKGYGGPHIAEKLGIPAVFAPTIPIFVPTAAFPALGFPDLGGWWNRRSYGFIRALIRLSMSRSVRAWRAEHGLPRLRSLDLTRAADGSAIPVLHPISRHVISEPADWPESAHMTGFWFLDAPEGWAAPPALEAFLAAGPPPVYVGFGSMAGRDPERLAGIVVEALSRSGTRGVLATGWGGLRAATDMPGHVFVIDQAPHEALFPRMAAVVHHGGAGTTAAGLRAGRLSIVVPFFGDQPFWGARIAALGAGPAPIPAKKLTAAALAEAIREATDNPEMRRAAETLGEKIRAENGVAEAVRLIEASAKT